MDSFKTIILTFLVLCFTTCQCQLQDKKFEYGIFEGKCFDVKSRREMYVGDYFQRSGECVRVQCLGDLTIWEDKCNEPVIEGSCVKEYMNLDQPYPKCCPQYKCEYQYGSTREIKVFDHYGTLVSRGVTSVVFVEDNAIGDVNHRIKIRV